MAYAIATGNPFDGMTLIGPFEDADEASSHATFNVEKPWSIVAITPPYWYVAVYLRDRAYGGPEEGGWWYDTGELQRFFDHQGDEVDFAQFTDKHDAINLQEKLQAHAEFSNEGRPDIGSVNSRGRYEVVVQEDIPRNYPDTRPHYE